MAWLLGLAAIAPTLPTAAVAAGGDRTETVTPAAMSPVPPDRSIRKVMTLAGKRLHYVVTAGTLTLRGDRGDATGEIVFVAYTVPTRAAIRRPVTFSFNGGPGAAQLHLNFGAIGPKRVDAGEQGNGPSDPPIVRDNPASWLGFTDLVFIDPIGTGYSRSLLNEADTRKAFLTADSDVHYLSEAIYEWLRANGRMRDPKYLVGESYGGYRVARIARYLQTDLSIGVSGVVMVSPALIDVLRLRGTVVSPIREMIYLPSAAATNIEAHGGLPTAERMAPIEAYARDTYLPTLLTGTSDPAAEKRAGAKVAELTGLPEHLITRSEGRISDIFLREFRRQDGKVSSAYDGNLTAVDPIPSANEGDYDDPGLVGGATREEAMVDLLDRELGWRVDRRYVANNYDLNATFDRGAMNDQAVTDLRKALANDPKLKVLITNGWTDFACPYFASRIVVDQLPVALRRQVAMRVYPGGHTFYDRSASADAFVKDVKRIFGQR